MIKPKLLQQGAEAKIFLTKDNTILKSRIPKSYRHPSLDSAIRTRRTKSEARNLTRALAAKANVPKILHTDSHDLQIEYIKGDRLSQTLNEYNKEKQIKTMQKIGTQVAKLHANNIIHADLTTSNIILSNNKTFLIDFGLSYISTKTEDKAVDLHLLKQALEAKHFLTHETLFKNFLKTYKDKEVIKRLETVEKRGRYKH